MAKRKIAEYDGTENPFYDRVQELIAEGNKRHVIIRNSDGQILIDTSMTISAVALGLFLFIVPGAFFFLMMGVVLGIVTRTKIQIVHELNEDEEIIEVNHD